MERVVYWQFLTRKTTSKKVSGVTSAEIEREAFCTLYFLIHYLTECSVFTMGTLATDIKQF